MKFHIVPVYNDIFPEEKAPTKLSLLQNIPTERIVLACCHINAALYSSENRFETEIMIFNKLIERIPNEESKTRIKKNFFDFIQRITEKIVLFPLSHTLKLIEESYLNYVPGSHLDVTPEQELDVLKLLLIHNAEANDRLNKILEGINNISDVGKFYPFFWSSLLPINTFLQHKNIILALYKSLKFLQFLDTNYKNELNQYLKINGCRFPNEIPVKIFNLFFNGYNKTTKTHCSFFKAEHTNINQIIQELSFNLKDYDREEFLKNGYDLNLKGIRTNPFIRYVNGDMGVSNWNFVIEKLYDGLVFDFYNKSGIKELKGHKSLGDYKSKLGESFSNPLFMNIMKELFSKDDIVALGEKERNQNCNYDFYIRVRNHVFIFEFKDIFFPIKENYEEIKNTIDEKLLGDKGVGQLIKQITKLSNNPEGFDNFGQYDNSRLFIYPIIVYTDYSFGITGISHYVNTFFSQNLPNDVKKKFFVVNPITLIDFDFFLENYDSFKSGQMDLISVLNSYFQIKKLNFEIQAKNPITQNILKNFEGFGSVISSKYPYNSKQLVSGHIYDYVLNEIRPYLADGKKAVVY